jgi:hypothetical protein
MVRRVGSLVAHQPVEDAAGLLGVDLPLVDVAGNLHGGQHGVAGDLLEQHPVSGHLAADLVGHVPGDGFAFPVGVGGEIDLGCAFRRLLEIGQRLGLALDGHVLGLEPAVHVHTQLPGGEVAEVADRGLHVVPGAQVLANGLGLGGRLDDDERAPRPGRPAVGAAGALGRLCRLGGFRLGGLVGGFLHRAFRSFRHGLSVTAWMLKG